MVPSISLHQSKTGLWFEIELDEKGLFRWARVHLGKTAERGDTLFSFEDLPRDIQIRVRNHLALCASGSECRPAGTRLPQRNLLPADGDPQHS